MSEKDAYIIDRFSLCVLLLAIGEVFGSGDLHRKPEIANATAAVGFDQDISRIHVSMCYTRLKLICNET